MPVISAEELLNGCKISENDGAAATVAFFGDLFPGGAFESFLMADEDNSIWGHAREVIAECDVSMANLECPLTGACASAGLMKMGPSLRANPSCAERLRRAGFTAVSLANNHILDMGAAGVTETIDSCRAGGLHCFGAGENKTDARRPYVVKVNDRVLSFIAIAENEVSAATENKAGANVFDFLENLQSIRLARESSDIVVVLFHAGNEMYALPNPFVVRACRFFVEAGADAVICCHSHVPGGIELYNQAVIAYGLGNFIFDWPVKLAVDWYRGYSVSLSFAAGGPCFLKITPYWQCCERMGIRRMDSEETQQFVDHLNHIQKIIGNGEFNDAFHRFALERRVEYMNMIFGLNKMERFLMRRGVAPWWKMNRSRTICMKGLFSCESHNAAALACLEGECSAVAGIKKA